MQEAPQKSVDRHINEPEIYELADEADFLGLCKLGAIKQLKKHATQIKRENWLSIDKWKGVCEAVGSNLIVRNYLLDLLSRDEQADIVPPMPNFISGRSESVGNEQLRQKKVASTAPVAYAPQYQAFLMLANGIISVCQTIWNVLCCNSSRNSVQDTKSL